MAIRAWSPEALQRRVESIERTGLGRGWIDGDVGHGPAYQFTDPDGHLHGAVLRRRALLSRPSTCVRRCVTSRSATSAAGRASSGLTTSTCSPPTSPPTGGLPSEQLGFRLYEQIVLDDGTESGAWMSLTIAAHELIYVADNAGANGRLHHLAFFVDTREECLRAADLFLDADVPIEAAPSKHAVAQGMFLYVYEPGGNRVEVTTGTHFIYDPEYEPVAWTQAERARGQAWGVKTIETFHTYGTPDTSGEATGPPIPPTSRIPGRDMSDDRQLIRDLVENWVVWRDAGDWERFASVWHDDGYMMATWFQGPAADFIRVSREGFERGVSILHFLGGTSIDLAGERAIVQTKMTISQRAEVHG